VASAPVVHLLYGSEWTAAGPVLAWLALLGALRILFELIYDYFVVLANTRVVFTVQVVWLLALLPAVYLGVQAAGPAGAAVAQFAVGALVVLPVYLYELNRTGIAPVAVGARVVWPLAGAAAAGAVAAVATRAIAVDLVALSVVAAGGLAAIGILVYRRRAVLASLRNVQVAE
jgi:PST family polysaccharide transporter